ncbi:MAG: NIPSNAP family protein [Bacteroidota bacterium]|nr:NIPSNAP family protein [Bacteroidota bacterium]
MKKITLFILLISAQAVIFTVALAVPPAKNSAYFVLRVYHYKNSTQEASIDSFLQYKYLPFLHTAKLSNIGVFKAIANDTATDKRLYVFMPFQSLQQWEKFAPTAIEPTATGDGSYVNTLYNDPVYTRFETILLKAFPSMPPIAPSKLTGPKSERVYELRSYEGPTEKYFRSKVKMFDQGGEIPLFARLGFNGVFYSEVIFGSKMPNLMYMTSFDNMQSREEHWKAFTADAEWKVLAAKPEYQHNVSKNEIVFLRPTEYSEL